jgi:hypothetical protein
MHSLLITESEGKKEKKRKKKPPQKKYKKIKKKTHIYIFVKCKYSPPCAVY